MAARSTFTHSFTDEQHSSGRRTKFTTTVYFPAPFEALRNTCLGGNADFGTVSPPPSHVRICIRCGLLGREEVHSRTIRRKAVEGNTPKKGASREEALLHSLPRRHASYV